MFWISNQQLLPDFWIRAAPEASQIRSQLNRPAAGREQFERDGYLARAEARAVGETEELLHLDGCRDDAGLAIFERDLAAARHFERSRCQTRQIATRLGRESVLDFDISKPCLTRASLPHGGVVVD